jgi:hypothetical protein
MTTWLVLKLHFRGTTLLQNVSNHLPAKVAHTKRPEFSKTQLSQPTANIRTQIRTTADVQVQKPKL